MTTCLAEPKLLANPTVRGTNVFLWQAAPARSLGTVEPRVRILYADDEPQPRRLGELALAESGYEVDTAPNGAKAWEALRNATYDLLITADEMPGLTGLKLAEQARRAGMRLPIVLASSSVNVLRDPAIAWLGFAACLQKPLGVAMLLETVGQILRAAKSLSQINGRMTSVLARIARDESYCHGGIND